MGPPQVTVLNADNAILMDRVDHASLLGEPWGGAGRQQAAEGARCARAQGEKGPLPAQLPCLHPPCPADVTVGTTALRPTPADPQQRQGHHAVRLANCHSVLVARWGARGRRACARWPRGACNCCSQPLISQQPSQPNPRIKTSPVPPSRRFHLAVRYHHDLAAADGSQLNVFTGGSGLDLAILSAGGGCWGEIWGGAGWGGGAGRGCRSGLGRQGGGQNWAGSPSCRASTARLKPAAPAPATAPYAGPQANLFSDIDTGAGSRLFESREDGGGAGWATTFYNLRASAASTRSTAAPAADPAAPPLPGCEAGSQLNFYGSFPGWPLVREGGGPAGRGASVH